MNSFNLSKKTAMLLSLILCSAIFAAPEAKLLASLKSYTPKDLENVTSVIIVFKDEEQKTINSKFQNINNNQISNFKFHPGMRGALSRIQKLFPDIQMKRTAQLSKQTRAARNLQNMYVAEIEKGRKIVEVLNELNNLPEVEYAEPNFPIKVMAAPNDPRFNDLWALNNTGQDYVAVVNDVQTTSRGTADSDIDWLGAWENVNFPTNEVIVAVVDTGVDYTHEELVNQMWINTNEIPLNGIDDDNNGYVDDYLGYDFINEDGDPTDDHGHGTHCSGTIGAETDNGAGISGIFPSAKIMALKFLNESGSGYTADGARAIKYAADNGAKVINNSWGSGARLKSLEDVIDYANEKGCVVISAAGNNNTTQKLYPAGYKNSMAVAATTSKDKKADFSNYGDWIDVSAPGENILSLRAKNTDMYAPLGAPFVHIVDSNLYLANGTSMAAPHVSGAAALLTSGNPGHQGWVYGKVISATADNIDSKNPSYAGELGSGRINVQNLLAYDNAAVFVNASLPLLNDLNTEFIGPGATTNLLISLGTWNYTVSNVTVVISNLTSGVTLSDTSIFIGTIGPAVTTNLPADSVLITTRNSKETTEEKILVQVLADGVVMDETIISFTVFNGYAGSVAIADLDNDGSKEFITTHDNQLIVYDSNGLMKWYFQSPAFMMPFQGAAVGDVDGDGLLEVIAGHNVSLGGGEIGLYVFEHDGTIKEGWPINDGCSSFEIPVIVDVDEDGIDDIVVGCHAISGPSLRAYKSDRTRLWSRQGGDYTSVMAPAVGDLDNDGWPELVNVFYSYGDPGGKIFVSTREGKDYGTTIAIPAGYYVNNLPSLGDIDGDGDLEILINAYKFGGVDNRIFAYHHTGEIVTGWPQDSGPVWIVRHLSPCLADIDGDGDLEIFAGAWETGVYGWDGDGTPLPNFPIADTKCRSQVCIEDIDNDGEIELVYGISSSDSTGIVPTNTIIRARNLDGSIVPGFDSLMIADSGEVYDMAIEPINGHTNQQIMVIGGGYRMFYTELFMVDTGFSSNQLPRAWPNYPHDNRRTFAISAVTNPPFVASFHAGHTTAISSMNAVFSSYIKEPYSTNRFYQWDFDNDGVFDAEGVNLTTTNAVYGLGTHSVSITISNGLGAAYSRTRSNYLHVIPPVECNFSASILTADAPFKVYFTDLSTNQPQYREWDFNGDGYIDSFLQNPSHIYTSTGIFNVSLTVSNDFGLGGASTSTETKYGYIVVPEIADSSVHYVSKNGSHLYPFKSWEEAANDIQSAVFSADPGELVLVTNGVYESDNSIYITNIIVRSVNGAEKTIIQGTYKNGCVKMTGTNALLEGFTVQRGAGGSGAGVRLIRGASIRNCIINDNHSGTFNGGGIYCHYMPGVVDNCLIISNSGRHGAGIYMNDDYVVQNCVIKNNTSDAFGDCIIIYESRLRNCLITKNTAQDDLIFIRNGAIIENCTITDNTFPAEFAVLEILFSGFVYNSIFYGNSSGYCNNRSAGVTYWNSCFDVLPDAAYLGDGNIALNPMFISPAAENYFLKALSPGINSGSNYFVSTTNDIYGRLRIIDGNVDMGCIENNVSFSLIPPEIISPTNISPGESGAIIFDSPGQDIIIEGYKNSNSYVYLEDDFQWTDVNVYQESPDILWSNILYNVQETIHVLKFKSMSSDFTNASAGSTELTIEVLPEPGIGIWIIGMLELWIVVKRGRSGCRDLTSNV